MSGISHQPVNAMDVEAKAAEWLERLDRGDWGEADQTELNSWLENPAHRIAYLRLHAAWDYANRLAGLKRAPAETSSRKFSNFLVLQIAAALVFFTILGVFAAQFLQKPSERIYRTAIGGRELVSFADGTKIELNTNTVLRTRMTSSERTIWLDTGEAYFQVKHDQAHPFTVIAGNRRITDLGTDFLVRRDDARLEVAVMHGSVRYAGARQAALLLPGDVVTASGNAMSKTRVPVRKLLSRLGWRRGVLIFDNTTLADAAEEFNRYNHEKLVVTDPAAAALTIGGNFPAQDVSAFTDVAQDVLGLRVERHGDEIVISH